MRAITTKAFTIEDAAYDIVRKINQQLIEGDKASVYKRGETTVIDLDFAFDAAPAFLGGSGVYGEEGFGPCGPYLDIENLPEWLEVECLDSVTVGLYDQRW